MSIDTDETIIQEIKDFLKITDEKDDIPLLNLIEDAKIDIRLKLKPFADVIPLTDAEFLIHVKKAQVLYVISCWKDKANNHDAAEKFMKKFDGKIKDIIAALKSDHTGRTKIVISAQKYDTEDDILFSQRILR